MTLLDRLTANIMLYILYTYILKVKNKFVVIKTFKRMSGHYLFFFLTYAQLRKFIEPILGC